MSLAPTHMSNEEEEPKKQYSRRERRTTRSTAATESKEASASALGLVVSPEGTTTRRSPPQDDGSIDTESTPPPRNLPPSAPPAASSIIYEDFNELSATMTNTTSDHDYLSRLEDHHKRPISKPNLSDGAAIVLAIGNDLQYESTYYGTTTGLAFLVDDEDTQMLRASIDRGNLPASWTAPVRSVQRRPSTGRSAIPCSTTIPLRDRWRSSKN